MKIAIVHYHLNRGGVTQVVANHLRALNQQNRAGTRLPVALIHGGRCAGWSADLLPSLQQLDVSVHAVDELDYDNVRPSTENLARQLLSTLQRIGFEPGETVLHAHNHSLGKNSDFAGTIGALASANYGVLLHIHDFAEDFRPENYRALSAGLDGDSPDRLPGLVYPQASQIHYAVLNQRDHLILADAGVDSSRLHLLPNAVTDIGPLPPREQARAKLTERCGIPAGHRYVLYPVRAIRRKNMGEALLWSALADDATSVGVTLAPLNPVEQQHYTRWTQLAGQLGLRFAFGVGEATGLDFAENLSACDLILTTSVAEGFGLGFLESWLAGRPIVGRDLPDITADFVSAGLRFTGLSPALWIPVEWLGADEFRRQFFNAYSSVLASYGRPISSDASCRRDLDALIQDSLVDFGHCGSSLQGLVIERVVNSRSDRQCVLEINPWIERALQEADPALIGRNAEVVRTHYSLAGCGARLMDIYRRVSESDRDDGLKPPPHGERILEQFLDPSRFHPVRVES